MKTITLGKTGIKVKQLGFIRTVKKNWEGFFLKGRRVIIQLLPDPTPGRWDWMLSRMILIKVSII